MCVSILWCGGEFTHSVGGRCVCEYIVVWCGGVWVHAGENSWVWPVSERLRG